MSDVATTPDPSRAALDEDLDDPSFQDGIVQGWWRVDRIDWPYLYLAVTAGDGDELGMRVDVDGYPGVAPAGIPWDLTAASPLPPARLPTGSSAEVVFRSQWSLSNANTPYMATERLIIQRDHMEWATAHPGRAWTSARTITFYAAELHAELRGCALPGEEAS